jgi:hypothetical protein
MRSWWRDISRSRAHVGAGILSQRGMRDWRRCKPADTVRKITSGLGFAVVGGQRNGSLCGQQEEGKCLLEVEADRLVIVA